MASIAWAPKPPSGLMIGGAVKPSTKLKWDMDGDDSTMGYIVHWRDTTSPQWEHSRYVGKVSEYTLENVVIDNYLFGVSSVSKNGNQSVVAYPTTLIPRR